MNIRTTVLLVFGLTMGCGVDGDAPNDLHVGAPPPLQSDDEEQTEEDGCPLLDVDHGYDVATIDFRWQPRETDVNGVQMYFAPPICFTMPDDLDALVMSLELPDVAEDPSLNWWVYFSQISIDGTPLLQMEAYDDFPLEVPFGTAWEGPAGWPQRGMSSFGLPFDTDGPDLGGAVVEVWPEAWEIPAWGELGGDMDETKAIVHFGTSTLSREEREHSLSLNIFIDSSLLENGTDYGDSLSSGKIVEAHLNDIIDTFNDLFLGEPTIDLGVVGILPDGFTEVSNIGPVTAIASQEADPHSVNMFLIDSISGSSVGNGWTLGRAGGRPGAALPGNVSGHLFNGVVVAAGAHRSASGSIHPAMSDTAAHEIGHYLGLFHTSEVGGRYHDPLEDTAECTVEFTYDYDTWVDDCDEEAIVNLMWPVSYPVYDVTNDQAWIAASHPLVK